MADTDYFEIPATLPSGDSGKKIRALQKTVNGTLENVGVSVIVDPTDPTIGQAVDATYGAAVDVKRTALATGAASSANQSSEIALLTTIDADTSTLAAVDFATGADVAALLTDTQLRAAPVPVSVSGVATAEKQDTGNASLASIDNKLPAQGQALAAASMPVVLPAAQIATLTPPAAITGFATSAKQDTAQTTLTAIDGHVDGIEASLTSLDGKAPVLGQALAAGSVPVVLTAAQLSTLTPPAAITGFATLAEQQTQTASLSVLDDWDESDRAKVNLIAGQAGIAGGTGVDGATVPRVSLATNVPLPTGSNAIGKLAANSGVDIGDVDVTSVPTDPFGANADAAVVTDTTGTISGKLRGLIKWAFERMPASLGQKVMASSLGVVIASDQTVLPISDNSGSLTVDAPVGTPAFVRLSDGAAAISTLPVSLASVPSHAVTIDAGAVTSLALIDDPVIQDDTAFTPATSKVMMAGFQADESSTDSVDEGDAGAARMTLDRKLIVTAQPHTAGGLSTFMASGSDGSSILVATAQAIKASAGQLYGYYAYNPETAVTFLHFYNTAAASVTVGTTNPLFTIAIPPLSAANLMFPHGVTFSNAGWSCAATTTAGGNTAPATGISLVAWYM